MNLVFLPATEPNDPTYGAAPERIEAFPEVTVHQVHFPTLVWYNQAVCRQAIAQILALKLPPVILVGFSKSGLGAWNITRAIPGSISSTIIFDAPVARDNLPPWGTDPFYRDDAEWQQDLPLRSVVDFRETVSQTHRLVLISGTGFHQEMCTLSQALSKAGLAHVFLPRPDMQHHWNSGWIEEGLSSLLAPAHRVG